MINRQVTLKSHPVGVPTPEDFGMTKEAVPELEEGQFLVRNLYFSLEAAIRAWLSGKKTYFEPIPIGGVIRGPSVGRVVESRNPNFKAGDIAWGLNHWEDYSVMDDNTILLEKLQVRPGIPVTYYVGGLGGSGKTAYIGLHEVGRIKEGETIVISAAAGATGSMAGQIAKLRGLRVIGIVSTREKGDLITKKLGMDAAVMYRETPDITKAVLELCPEGVDVYFDNVGGMTLDAMFLCMKTYGRIIGCGMISQFNRQDNPTPIQNIYQMVARQLTFQGFLLPTYMDRIPAAVDQLQSWVVDGKLKLLENITEGLANCGKAYSEMMKGATIGKNLVKMDFPEED
ncbi:NADP-dependent oxidoreductase [uncultured Desulfosarcina sp.]|uniref:MDR family NADP-dependent oxidoreductase n=1 Tax=uncultured Desulfosarcina sp. TaxID=218289 RepID=UPI0029C74D66|nr:NADP-dependent oxidoreductase [uncultured Desulfosarcina sp.]